MKKQLLTKELLIDGEKRLVLAASYSQIDSFLSCPYKWFLDYFMGRRSNDKAEALDLGSAIHETLEQLGHDIKEGKQIELAESLKTLDERMNENNIPFASIDNELEAIEQHTEMLEGLYKKDNNLSKLLLGNEIVGIEMPFVYEVKLPFAVLIDGITYNSVYLNGAIDLILKDEHGDYIVVDYKSGKKKFDNTKLKKNLQQRIYSAVVLKEFGVLPKYCKYYFTRLDLVQDVEPMCLYEKDAIDHYYEKGRYKGKLSHRQFSVESLHEKLVEIFKEMYCPEKAGKYRANQSPLCAWCSHGKYYQYDCNYASEYTRSDMPLPVREKKGVSCVKRKED